MKKRSFIASVFAATIGVMGLAQSAWCVPVSEYATVNTSSEEGVERSTASVESSNDVDHDKLLMNETCQAAQSPSNGGTGYRAGSFK